jgi:hypothetical protein
MSLLSLHLHLQLFLLLFCLRQPLLLRARVARARLTGFASQFAALAYAQTLGQQLFSRKRGPISNRKLIFGRAPKFALPAGN